MKDKISRYQEGIFWEYEAPKPKHKIVKPDPVWLNDDYLPNLDKALSHQPNEILLDDLWTSHDEPLVFDIECYNNYFLIYFKSTVTGKVISFELDETKTFNISYLRYIFEHYLVISFNGIKYDMIIAAFACAGYSAKQLHDINDAMIIHGERGWNLLKSNKVKKIQCNHIDLIEVCPLSASLKEYAARLHCPQLQDLPFSPEKDLSENQKVILKWYCHNDLDITELIYNFLKKNLDLRYVMGHQYGIDLRSKSDAQIAESVISKEVYNLNGVYPQKSDSFLSKVKYDAPSYINFKTEQLQRVLALIKEAVFTLDGGGSPVWPVGLGELEKTPSGPRWVLKVDINGTIYKLGMGGLHSQEKCNLITVDSNHFLIDRDVTSYYPFIILNDGLYPENIGPDFLTIFRKIVFDRLDAKRTGDKMKDASLKVTINGSFGKFGSMYSILYSPKLLLQVTITGQLSLLYLIEKIELAGIRCLSANTDGVVIKCPNDRHAELNAIVKEWETETSFNTDETKYLAVASQSVNSYMALKTDMSVKGKGKLGWGITKLFKNPDLGICTKAIENFMSKGLPVEDTIRNCKDIGLFLIVRKVKGGAVKDGEFLGKVVRFYYSTKTDSPIVYAKSGNKVPRSEGGMPLMEIKEFPSDIDYAQYIRECKKMLADMGLRV